MRLTLPFAKAPIFILEERLQDNPAIVHHAWPFDSKDEALDQLAIEATKFGHERLYTVYVHVED